MYLTDEEQDEIRRILSRARARERQTATSSREGFFAWLKGTSLGWLVMKLLDWTWTAIKSLFGF